MGMVVLNLYHLDIVPRSPLLRVGGGQVIRVHVAGDQPRFDIK